MIIKTCVLLLILMLAPSGRVYSPAAQTSPAHKPVAITAPVKTAPAPTTAVDYTSKPTLVHSNVLITPVSGTPQSTSNTPTSGKDDGGCPQPYATVGRCADKCPNIGDTLLGFDPTTGASICQSACPAPEFVRGFDKDTGAVVCGYVTGCPYGDSVPLGPMCYKNCLNTNPQAATDPTVCYQGTGYSG